ncbi:MAG: CDP-alcohol phosphatidyltransferase family protein [Dehalococcoidia bacterium]|nr:CDP-alcohol phosphatidyltransferase family protein [Dehalococcoidia bacterium]
MHRLRNLLSPIVDGIARVLVKLGFSPSGLTVIGVLIACVAAALISQGLLAIGGIVMLIAGIFDMFDGAVARMTDRATKFGAFFDSVMDRVSEAVVLLGLLWFYLDDGEQLGAVLVYVSIVGSTLVSYVRARAEGLGIECKGGLMQRPERVASLGVGIIVGQWWESAVLIVLGVIAALTVVTTVQRVVETARRAGE